MQSWTVIPGFARRGWGRSDELRRIMAVKGGTGWLAVDQQVHNAVGECLAIRIFGVSQDSNAHSLFRDQKNGRAGSLLVARVRDS